MPDRVHNWPAELQRFLTDLKRNPDLEDCFWADLELSPDEVADLSLFEVAARNGRVRFNISDGTTLVGCMNPLLGLGRSARCADCAKVRVSFHGASVE
jgi:hypothetical protein